MHKTALIPVVAAAGLLLTAAPAHATYDHQTLHLTTVDTSNVMSPHGYTFTAVVQNAAGETVGNDLGACLFNRTATKAYCQVTLTLDRGTILANFVTTDEQSVVTGVVSGGSGRYADVTGSFSGVLNGPTTAVTLTYQR